MKPHTDYDYNYFALFQGVCVLVLAAGLIILALNNQEAIRRGMRYLGAWYRERRGDVLTAGLLLTVIRVTFYKHGAWLSATALLSLAIGMAA